MSLVAEALHARGKLASPAAKSVSAEEVGFFGSVMGGNVRVRAERAIAMGWKPKENSFTSALEDVDAFLATSI